MLNISNYQNSYRNDYKKNSYNQSFTGNLKIKLPKGVAERHLNEEDRAAYQGIVNYFQTNVLPKLKMTDKKHNISVECDRLGRISEVTSGGSMFALDKKLGGSPDFNSVKEFVSSEIVDITTRRSFVKKLQTLANDSKINIKMRKLVANIKHLSVPKIPTFEENAEMITSFLKKAGKSENVQVEFNTARAQKGQQEIATMTVTSYPTRTTPPVSQTYDLSTRPIL